MAPHPAIAVAELTHNAVLAQSDAPLEDGPVSTWSKTSDRRCFAMQFPIRRCITPAFGTASTPTRLIKSQKRTCVAILVAAHVRRITEGL